jgi:hypothetical protein
METTPITIAGGRRFGRDGRPVAVGPAADLVAAHAADGELLVTDGPFAGETVRLCAREMISWGRTRTTTALRTWTVAKGPHAGTEMAAYLVDTARLDAAPKVLEAALKAAERLRSDPDTMQNMTGRAEAEERALSRDAD